MAIEKIHALEKDLLRRKEELLTLQTEATSLRVALSASTEDRMRQIREIEDRLRKDVQKSQERVQVLEEQKLGLTEELTVKKEEVLVCNRQLEDMKILLADLQDRLAKVLSDPTAQAPGPGPSAGVVGSGGVVSIEEYQAERDQRTLAVARLEAERAKRVEAENNLASAEQEWDRLSTLVGGGGCGYVGD